MKTKNLTIQEAIQSGCYYRRPCYDKDFWLCHYKHHSFTKEEVLAQDWEIKVPEVTITREKLAEAWESYEQTTIVSIGVNYSPLFQHICKKLGL